MTEKNPNTAAEEILSEIIESLRRPITPSGNPDFDSGRETERESLLDEIETGWRKATSSAEEDHAEMDAVPTRFGKWVRKPAGMTPGGTPLFACGNCGGSEHLHGAEYPQRKLICDHCGQVNIYPWEKSYEEEGEEAIGNGK